MSIQRADSSDGRRCIRQREGKVGAETMGKVGLYDEKLVLISGYLRAGVVFGFAF